MSFSLSRGVRFIGSSPRHALSLATSPARSARVARSLCSLASLLVVSGFTLSLAGLGPHLTRPHLRHAKRPWPERAIDLTKDVAQSRSQRGGPNRPETHDDQPADQRRRGLASERTGPLTQTLQAFLQ